jgi:glutathione S-transferase
MDRRAAAAENAPSHHHEENDMLTLCYCPGACSMASHIVLEESGEKYDGRKIDLGKGEQRSADYLKINPHARVPALGLDNGEFISENTAILPFLGKRFGLWSSDPVTEAKMMSFIGWVASSVHPAQAHIGRPERYASDPATHDNIKATGKKVFHEYLTEIDGMYAGKDWLFDKFSVADPYAFVLYTWGVRRELPMSEMTNYTAFKDRMLQRPAVQRVVADEKIAV